MKENHACPQCQGLASPKLQKVKRETACSGYQSFICVERVCWRRNMEIPILFHLLTESSYAVLHSAWKTLAVKCSWLVVQLMNTGLHLLGTNPPSDHLLTRGSGFLLIHIDAKQNYLHLNHWCFLESKCYEKVGPLAGSLDESHFVGQRLCPSGWFIHSWTWEAPTASKNLALVMKCQCAALNLQVVCITYCWIWSKWMRSIVHNFLKYCQVPHRQYLLMHANENCDYPFQSNQ